VLLALGIPHAITHDVISATSATSYPFYPSIVLSGTATIFSDVSLPERGKPNSQTSFLAEFRLPVRDFCCVAYDLNRDPAAV
jgi:hypothetical protein